MSASVEKKPRLCIYFCGFNIAIVPGLLITLFGRLLPRRRLVAILLILGAVTAYSLLAGASPPVERAATMGAAGMFDLLLGPVGLKSRGVTGWPGPNPAKVIWQ